MNEEPKTFYARTDKPLIKNKRLAGIILAGLCFLFFFVLYLNSKPADQKGSISATAEEPRALYTKNEIENLIKDRLTAELEKQETVKQKASRPKTQIKLISKIAVFVKETKEERIAMATKKQSQELVPMGENQKHT